MALQSKIIFVFVSALDWNRVSQKSKWNDGIMIKLKTTARDENFPVAKLFRIVTHWSVADGRR